MGLLMPDRRTVLQMQPVFRCSPGAPMLARWGNHTDGCPQQFPNETDILGDGALGAHGGSGLSSFGGNIRLGELDPNNKAPIQHALKLELWGARHYFGLYPLQNATAYNGGRTQYVWPATGSDDNTAPPHGHYNGTNPHLCPGALLALPASAQLTLKTEPARRIAQAFRDYGGYLVDSSSGYADKVSLVMESGVDDELKKWYNMSMAFPYGCNPNQSATLFEDLLHVLQSLEIVINNGPNSVGGGGTPRAPLAPPICAEPQDAHYKRLN